MRIKERPEYKTKHKPLAFPPHTTLRTALNKMAKRHYGSVIIVNDNQNVIGIVTERDLMLRVLHENKDIAQTKLSDIMTANVYTAHDDDSVYEWLRIMSDEHFRHLPIVNENDQLINVMSLGDFVSYAWPALFDSVKQKTRTTLGRFYEIILIAGALLGYALAVYILID